MSLKVLLFAGTFDPITAAHLLMLRQAAETEFFDKIWILPSGKRTDKVFTASDEVRFRQCEIAAKQLEGIHSDVEVCDYEIKKGENIDSYFTMRYFQETYPEYDFYFFVGSDLLPQIVKWPYGDELVKITKFLIAYREGYPILKEDLDTLKQYKLLSDLLQHKGRSMEASSTSSTLVRSQLASNVKCDEVGTLHPEIMNYITQNGFYRQRT
ncbi:nicotinate-nucleotide adenylyltransferase [Babesia ovata]|uniref:Nicotinate-nucleotide adenylyltransferase n=1 Tax=Babesia ovata TaxID=189622 RepID=A0A2H6K8V6_9APIC|nr:nicotinate-nucleotide adenylyltransferase [Babesia ovata]GBE59442.1 nicotinate-nucleotide adenylyltransferase [Babesia ovata]